MEVDLFGSAPLVRNATSVWVHSHGDRSLTTVYCRLSRMSVLRICSLYSSYRLKVSFVILPPSVVSPLPPHFLEEKSQDTITGLAQGLLTYSFLLWKPKPLSPRVRGLSFPHTTGPSCWVYASWTLVIRADLSLACMSYVTPKFSTGARLARFSPCPAASIPVTLIPSLTSQSLSFLAYGIILITADTLQGRYKG